MMVEAELAIVLHTRPYRETSQLVDLFSRHHGRLRVVARGARGGRGRQRTLSLRPFMPLLAGWHGRGELKTLTASESLGVGPLWAGEGLYLGLYLNELLVRLLPEHCADEDFFDHYRDLLAKLPGVADPEPLLRMFELALLRTLGYGLDLDFDSATGAPIGTGQWFGFRPGDGLTRVHEGEWQQPNHGCFAGEHLLAMAENRYDDQAVRRSAKRLLRLALQPHLGDRPLQARELFKGVAAGTNDRNSP